MKTKYKGHNRIVIAILVLITSLSVLACGAKSNTASVTQDRGSYVANPDEASKMTGDYAPEASMALAQGTNGLGADGSGGSSTQLLPSGRKLIRNASMNLETKVFDDLIAGINSQISNSGGYTENSNIYNGSYTPYYDYGDPAGSNYRSYDQSRSASITARIPVDKFDDFVTKVKTLGNVTQYSESVDDVTLQYTDVESHKKSLEVERDRLLDLIAEAKDLDTILIIENHLSDIRYQLDNYESQLRLYDNQVEYSTVMMDIREVIDYTQPEEHPQSIGDRISIGLSHTLNSIKDNFVDLFVWFVINLPILLILAVVLIVFVLIIKLITRKHTKHVKKEKKESKKDDETPQQQ